MIGDVNGDLLEDFVVSAIGDAAAYIVLSPDGIQSRTVVSSMASSGPDRFGEAVAGLFSDVDSGGAPDIIIGAPGFSDGTFAGYFGVFNSESGSLIMEAFGANAGDRLGNSVTNTSDIGGTAFRDILVGAPGAGNTGRVYAYLSGFSTTPTPLWTVSGGAAGDGFGASIANVRDLDGDTIDDFVVGAPSASPNGVNGAGYVRLYSTQTQSVLCTFNGTEANERFGESVASAGDVNNDGLFDFVVGAPGRSGGSGGISIFSYDRNAGNCFQLFDIVGQVANGELGNRLANNGQGCDVNNDGFSDLPVFAEDGGGGSTTGAVFIFGGIDSSTPTPTPTATPTPPLPSNIALDFRISREGVLNGRARFDVQDFGPCRFRLYGRRSWSDRTHRGPVRSLLRTQVNGDFNFSASGLPRARRAPYGRAYVYHMIGGLNCAGNILFSNVFARYTNGPLPAVEVGNWEEKLDSTLEVGVAVNKRARNKRRAIR